MSSDNSFFEELQTEFLNESAFLLESYEESMLGLENDNNPAEHLTQIFRVAHSIKGGAAAVGLTDLSKFAHVVEDLLAVLRNQPELVNSNIISLLLASGDQLKNRVESLRAGNAGEWDTSELVSQLIQVTEELTGQKVHHEPTIEKNTSATEEKKEIVPDDFFSSVLPQDASQNIPAQSATAVQEDHTNYDLLNELLSQLPPEEAAEYKAKEQKNAPVESEIIKQTEVTPVAPPQLKVVSDHDDNTEKKEAPPKKAATASTQTPGQAKSAGAKNTNSTIKVDTMRVDSVLDAVGELVVLKNQLVHDEYIKSGSNVRLEAIVDQLDKAVRELYEKTLSIRMNPLKSLFIKIQRIVRDVSIALSKPVDLQLIGEETEVERTVFELLNDPLVHIVRNSMDHGIEKPEIRKERGKPATAKVTVSAKQSGGNVIIDIIDDGGGINRDKVLKKAIEKGLVPQNVDPNSIPDEQVFQFIFAPGFSTADKVTDLSGRGVGLDVVKSNLEKINGKININSKQGVGTTFRLTIPLSTAITDGILISLDGARYILPIHSIREIVRAVPEDYTEISQVGKVVKIREQLLPVINVSSTLGQLNWEGVTKDGSVVNRNENSLSARRGESMLLILESMMSQMAFPVDDVIGQAQVVIKPISTGQTAPEVSGAAILGDGRTVLVLDPTALVQTASNGRMNSNEKGQVA